MTVNDALNQLPFITRYGVYIAIGFLALLVVTFLTGSCLIAIKSRTISTGRKITGYVFLSLAIVFALGTVGSTIGLGWTQTNLSKTQLNGLRSTPSTITSTSTVNITSIYGGSNYVSGVSAGSNYQYTVKLPDGSYQLKTLTTEYQDVNSNDVFIKKQFDVKSPYLLIQHHRYDDKRVRQFLNLNGTPDGEWTTYTFMIPQN